ncbi:MAG: hypothetical protein GY839_15405, partial [candidate division Zixibacteria bacterium]|nr:hypothetical protein [candidate division Zixibacteria bacterium]
MMKNQCLKTLCTTIFVALLITPVIADSVDPNSPDIVSIGKFGRQHIVVKPGEDFKVPVFIKCDEDIGSFTISIAVEKESIRKLIKVELTDEFAKRLEIEWGKSKQSVQGDEYNSYTLFCVSKNDRPFNTHRVWKQIASFIFEPVEDTSAVCTVSLIKSGDENGAVFRIANQKEFNPIFKIFHYSPDTVIIGQLDRQHIIVKRGEDFEIPVYVKCDEDLESFAISIAVEKEPIRKLKKVELTDRYANYLEIEWKQNKDSFQGDDYNSYTIICKSKNDRIFNTGGHSWKQIASFIFEPVRDTSVICTVSRILPGDENGAVFRTADHKEFNPVFKTLHFNIVPDDYEIQDLKKYRRRRPAERFVVGFNKGITAEEPVEKAYQYFEFRKDTLGLEYPRKEMLVNKVIEDSDETRVVFRQYVDDVGVCGTKYTFTFDESGMIIDVRGKVDPDAAGAAEPGKAISKEKALDTVVPIIEDNGLEIVDEKASYLAVI